MLLQAPLDLLDQLWIHEVRRRQIHGDVDIQACLAPLVHLPDGAGQRPAGELAGAAGVFGDGHEFGGRQVAQQRMPPAHQGFELADGAAGEVQLRLEDQPQGVGFDGRPQARGQLQPPPLFLVTPGTVGRHRVAGTL